MVDGMIKKWCVYLHTFPNGKRYIGITCKDPKKRFNYGYGYSKQPKMNRAIKKYGWKSVVSEILFDDLEENFAKLAEFDLITMLNAMSDEFGYNMTFGGEGTVGRKHTDEAKRKMSDIAKEKNRWYGKCGADCHNSIKVMCLNTREIFDSIQLAEKAYGLASIGDALRGKCLSYGKLNGVPLQWSYLDEFGNPTREMVEICGRNHTRFKKIECITTGEIFNSIVEACKKYKVHSSQVVKVATGRINTTGKLPDGTKLSWRYVND